VLQWSGRNPWPRLVGVHGGARGVKGQVGGSIPTGNNPPNMNGRRRVMGGGALGCSNLTASGARGGVARDVTRISNTCIPRHIANLLRGRDFSLSALSN